MYPENGHAKSPHAHYDCMTYVELAQLRVEFIFLNVQIAAKALAMNDFAEQLRDQAKKIAAEDCKLTTSEPFRPITDAEKAALSHREVQAQIKGCEI